METKKLLIGLLFIIALGALLMGCSELSPTGSGQSAAESNEPIPPMNLTHYAYPEAANYPPAGYQFVRLGANSTARSTNDPYNGFDASEHVIQSQGGSMWDGGSGIEIAPWGVPNSVWIAMTQPNPDEPWVEFEPHGLVFEGAQVARISYVGCEFPAGVQAGELTIWYWNEELGVYEYIGGVNHPDEQYIEYSIEHFSRYVVAAGS